MLGRSHVVTGVCVGLLALSSDVDVFQVESMDRGLFLIVVAIGSLLPDIDHPQSIISRQIPIVDNILRRFTTHRGFFHSILGTVIIFSMLWVLMAAGWSVIASEVGLSVIVDPARSRLLWGGLLMGYVNHIAGDMVTISGVKLLYPLPHNIGVPLFRTNSALESVLIVAFITFTFSSLYGVF